MRNKLIAGNWKMHGSLKEAAALIASLKAGAGKVRAELAVFPPYVFLHATAEALAGSSIALGAQDCAAHEEAQGAHTGDVSAMMLRNLGCAYVILGHSERRSFHGETDETVRRKAEIALAQGLTPIICVGETLNERQAGQAEAVVTGQVRACLPQENGGFCLAYEPVWAIGSGLTPSAEEVEAMHACIRRIADVRVLYGGSVKPENAAELLSLPGVGGALVGGASLKAEAFLAIAAAA